MTRDPLWRLASTRGLSRRRFLGLLAAGGAAAVLAACFGEDEGSESSGLFKDPGRSSRTARAGLESRLELMDGVITPNRLFFVRNNSPVSPEVDAAAWRLTVEGDAIDRPLELSYDELRRLPARTLVSYLECAGNHRVMFDRLQGRAAKGTQWGRGAVGNGVWLGVALADVLALAGMDDDAASVLLVGLDEDAPEGGFRRVVTAQKAMHPDTLLAYGLNGEILPRGPRLPTPSPRPRLGRQHEHQVARPHRRHARAAVDAQQHHLVRADRRRLPARGRGGRAGGDRRSRSRARSACRGRPSWRAASIACTASRTRRTA